MAEIKRLHVVRHGSAPAWGGGGGNRGDVARLKGENELLGEWRSSMVRRALSLCTLPLYGASGLIELFTSLLCHL